jgi:hypothetical protein
MQKKSFSFMIEFPFVKPYLNPFLKTVKTKQTNRVINTTSYFASDCHFISNEYKPTKIINSYVDGYKKRIINS